MTYALHGHDPSEEIDINSLDGSNGPNDRIVTGDHEHQIPNSLKRPITFSDCDIRLRIKDWNIKGWTFTRCKFDDTAWEDVKFSDCRFELCHFAKVSFVRCYFADSCTFMSNSASAELLRLESSGINAGKFVSSLQDNLEHLPHNVSRDYQIHRFIEQKVKLAFKVLSSVREESNTEFIDHAQKSFIIADLQYRIEKARYNGKEKRHAVTYWLMSLHARLERMIVYIAASLTNWGKSLLQPIYFGLDTVAAFAMIYWHFDKSRLVDAYIKAFDITLVAGYATYATDKTAPLFHAIELCNLLVGLFWFALLIPVVLKRLQR